MMDITLSNLQRILLRRSAVMLLAASLFGIMSTSATLAQPAETPPAQAADAPPADAPPATDGEPSEEQVSEAKRSLPKLAEMKLPSAEDLLRGPRRDWVVLKDEEQHVLITDPVTSRPNTLVKMQAALDEKVKQRKGLRGEELDKFRQELDAMALINLNLPSQLDESQYQIHMDKIAQVIHHEDLMLQRIDKLIEQENFELGYELLNTLRRNTPDWPGAAERHNQFLFAEARRRLQRGENESSLATLEEIYDRNPTFRGVPETAGSAIDNLVHSAIEADNWRRARHFINRLERMYASHPSVQRWKNELNSRAEQQLERAEQARSQGDHAQAALNAETAALIWPKTRNLRTRHRIFTDRYQRLHVGVLKLPTPDFERSVTPSRAEQRSTQLQTLDFFHVDNASDGSAHYSSRFCDRWEPLNLGREAIFELRSNRQPWEMQPVVTAPSVASRLARRLNPRDALYDERLSSYVQSIDVDSPYLFKIRFGRVPVRTESLLTIAIEQDAAADEPIALENGESPVSVDSLSTSQGGFVLSDLSEDTAVYRRTMPEPDGLRLYHVAEIHEHQYKTFGDVLQSILHGDVSLVPSLPPRQIQRLRNDEALLKSLFVEKMALPLTHVIQLNPRSKALKNREFRRALVYAIDRRSILSETVLDGAPNDLARVVTSPFPSESYANSALAVPREYDPVSAISLSLAARKQLGGNLPQLKMAVVDEPIVQAAARKVVESWKRFGIEVTIIPLPTPLVDLDTQAVEWDLLYRTVQMVEPVVDLWPFLTLTGRAQVSDLDPFPDWLRQEIINLDLIGDWGEAVQVTKRLHLQLWAEVMFIPLWEVDQYLVYRKNIRGVPVEPFQIYDDIDRWVVEAWFTSEEP